MQWKHYSIFCELGHCVGFIENVLVTNYHDVVISVTLTLLVAMQASAGSTQLNAVLKSTG